MKSFTAREAAFMSMREKQDPVMEKLFSHILKICETGKCECLYYTGSDKIDKHDLRLIELLGYNIYEEKPDKNVGTHTYVISWGHKTGRCQYA